MIDIVSGNLLEAQVEALVNTVNTEGVMGKGIALQFRQAFPAMFKAYLADCKAGAVRLGKMNVFDLGGLLPSGPRWIINFPT
jgi:O-acetyl-ADP-ribose deacetylase (regulator of RNase III)